MRIMQLVVPVRRGIAENEEYIQNEAAISQEWRILLLSRDQFDALLTWA